jgi:hypothetical protein
MAMVEKGKKTKQLLSATSIIIAALVIVIAANGIVWKNRLDKGAEIDLLTGEIDRVSQETQKATVTTTDFESRLVEARAGLAAAQMVFPPEFNRNDIIDYIINLARECQVEVLPISSQGWAVEKVGGQSYSVLKLSGTVTGTFTRANEFISRLQNGKYETLLVPEISFTRQSAPVGTGTFSGDNTMVTVRLSISVYARPAAIVQGNN